MGAPLASTTEAQAERTSALDVAAIEAWFAGHLPNMRIPLQICLIAGGHSNLTYRIDDAAGQRFVLRRPPVGKLHSRAHDVAREYRIFAALSGTSVPVPGVAALCSDPAVIGAPFYVMRWVEGTVVDSPEVAVSALPTDRLRTRAAEHVVDCLAALSRLDVDAIGLGSLGPRENFVARQLERLRSVWEKTKTRELPIIESLYERLMVARPPQVHTGLVHSDYRIGNLMLDASGRVAAVLDWELCAIGDVLADLGFLINNWDGPDDPAPGVWMREAPTRAAGFPDRAQIVARYAEQTGFNVADLNYYRAFCYWRIAVIGEGVKRRYETGAMAGERVNVAAMERRIQGRADLTDHFLRLSDG